MGGTGSDPSKEQGEREQGAARAERTRPRAAGWKSGNSQVCSVLGTREAMTQSRCRRGHLARGASEGKESRREKVLGLRKKFQRELQGELWM